MMLKYFAIAFLALLLAILLALVFVPSDWSETVIDEKKFPKLDTIVVNNWHSFLHIAALAFVVVSVVLSAGLFWFKRPVYAFAFLYTPIFLYPLCFFFGWTNNLAPWICFGHVQDEDGVEYQFLESSFLQGQTLALARRDRHGFFVDEYKVLVTTNGDSPRSYLLIVRPDESKEQYGKVILTKDKMLLGLRYENKMFLAFDLRAQRAYGRDAIESLSPFLCLDNHTPLRQGDLQRILDAMQKDETGRPTQGRLEEGTRHANEGVRQFCKKAIAAK